MSFELKNILAGLVNFNASADVNFTGGKLFGDICFIKVDSVSLPQNQDHARPGGDMSTREAVIDKQPRLLVASVDGTTQAIAITNPVDPSSGPAEVNLSEVLPFRLFPCHVLDKCPGELPFSAVLADRVALVVQRFAPPPDPCCVELTQFSRGQRVSVTLKGDGVIIAMGVNSKEFTIGHSGTIGRYTFAVHRLKLDSPHLVAPDAPVLFSASSSIYRRLILVTISHELFLQEHHVVTILKRNT